MQSPSNPTVGVVNAPVVAEALRQLGFRVLSADGFRDSATTVSNELKLAAFPVVVGETDATGVGPWVTSTAAKTTVVLLGTRPDLGISTTGAHRLSVPATVNDILPLIGYQATLDPRGDTVIASEVPAPAPAPAAPAAPLPLPLPLPLPAPAAAVAAAGYEPVAELYPPSSILREPEPTPAPVEAAVPAPAVNPGVPLGLFDEAPVQVVAPVPIAAPAYVAPAAPAYAAPDVPQLVPVAAPQPVYAPQPNLVVAPSLFDDIITPVMAPQPVYAPAPAAPQPVFVPAPAVPAPSFFDTVVVAAPVYTNPVAAHTEVDMYDGRENRRVNPGEQNPQPTQVRGNGPRGELLIFIGGKGGIGKTTQSTMAAKTASQAGLRTTLVDGNRGQADIRTFLRLSRHPLPTIYNAVQTGDPASALLLPDQYNQFRPATVEPLDFALVLGPPSTLADPKLATAEVYARVIDYARQRSDLVILDTQIAEAHMTDLFERLIIPAMISGAWSVAIVNESRAGADNLLERMETFAERGVTNARSLVLASMYEDFEDIDRVSIERKYGRYGTFIGSAGIDRSIKDQMNLGNFLSDSPAIAPATRAVLYRVTGNPVFAPIAENTGRRRWFGRGRK